MADHAVPLGARVLAPKNCENCRKPFLRKVGSDTKFCNPCRAMYAGAVGNQLWECRDCATERAWGDGKPQETAGKLLHCEHCHKITEHSFSKITSPDERMEYTRQNLLSRS